MSSDNAIPFAFGASSGKDAAPPPLPTVFDIEEGDEGIPETEVRLDQVIVKAIQLCNVS